MESMGSPGPGREMSSPRTPSASSAPTASPCWILAKSPRTERSMGSEHFTHPRLESWKVKQRASGSLSSPLPPTSHPNLEASFVSPSHLCPFPCTSAWNDLPLPMHPEFPLSNKVILTPCLGGTPCEHAQNCLLVLLQNSPLP